LNSLGLGIIYSRAKLQKAEEHLLKANRIFKELNQTYYRGCTLSDLGGHYFRQMRMTQSIYYYIRAIFKFHIYQYIDDLPRIYYSLAISLLSLNKWDFLSLPVIKIGMGLAQKCSSTRYFSLLHYALGRFFYYNKNYKHAEKHLNIAYNIYIEYFEDFSLYPENLFNITLMLGYTNNKLFNREITRKYILKLEEITENYLLPKSNKEIELEKANNLFAYMTPLKKLQFLENS